MKNPFEQALPVVVLLRNNTRAVVEQMVDDVPAFPLLGRMGVGFSNGCAMANPVSFTPDRAHVLWRKDGCWRENGEKHEHDIIGFSRLGAGFEPFAAAAGVKGDAA